MTCKGLAIGKGIGGGYPGGSHWLLISEPTDQPVVWCLPNLVCQMYQVGVVQATCLYVDGNVSYSAIYSRMNDRSPASRDDVGWVFDLFRTNLHVCCMPRCVLPVPLCVLKK